MISDIPRFPAAFDCTSCRHRITLADGKRTVHGCRLRQEVVEQPGDHCRTWELDRRALPR